MQKATTVNKCGQRKYFHASLNPKAKPSLALTLKLLKVCEWKIFMAVITEKLVIYVFPLT